MALQPWKQRLSALGGYWVPVIRLRALSPIALTTDTYREVLSSAPSLLFFKWEHWGLAKRTGFPVLTANRATRHRSVSLGVKAKFLVMPKGPPWFDPVSCFLSFLFPHHSPDHSLPALLMWPFHRIHITPAWAIPSVWDIFPPVTTWLTSRICPNVIFSKKLIVTPLFKSLPPPLPWDLTNLFTLANCFSLSLLSPYNLHRINLFMCFLHKCRALLNESFSQSRNFWFVHTFPIPKTTSDLLQPVKIYGKNKLVHERPGSQGLKHTNHLHAQLVPTSFVHDVTFVLIEVQAARSSFIIAHPAASLVAHVVKKIHLQCGRPGFDPLEEGMETHSSVLAWRIPMDRGAWRATVHGVTKSRTWLCD